MSQNDDPAIDTLIVSYDTRLELFGDDDDGDVETI